jgi:hypothetical protein
MPLSRRESVGRGTGIKELVLQPTPQEALQCELVHSTARAAKERKTIAIEQATLACMAVALDMLSSATKGSRSIV